MRRLLACQRGDCAGVDAAFWRGLRGELGARYVLSTSAVSPSLAAALGRAPLRPLAASGGLRAFELAPEAP